MSETMSDDERTSSQARFDDSLDELITDAVADERGRCQTILNGALHHTRVDSAISANTALCRCIDAVVGRTPAAPAPAPMTHEVDAIDTTIANIVTNLGHDLRDDEERRTTAVAYRTTVLQMNLRKDLLSLVQTQARRDAEIVIGVIPTAQHVKPNPGWAALREGHDRILDAAGLE